VGYDYSAAKLAFNGHPPVVISSQVFSSVELLSTMAQTKGEAHV